MIASTRSCVRSKRRPRRSTEIVAREFTVTGLWDSTEAKAALSSIDARHRRFAMSYAVNLTAKDTKNNLLQVLPRRIDRPTPFTMRSLFMLPGNRDNPDARILFKDRDYGAQKGTPAGEYLKPQVFGGTRRPKGLERAMQRRGLLQIGHFLIPSDSVQLDAYGNVPRGLITKIMSGLSLYSEVGFNMNATKSRRSRQKRNAERFFLGIIHGQPGIWERLGAEHVKPLFIEEAQSPHYRSRFPFFQIGENTVKAHFLKNLEYAIAKAIETANFKGRWS